jgi:hypothetical protein
VDNKAIKTYLLACNDDDEDVIPTTTKEKVEALVGVMVNDLHMSNADIAAFIRSLNLKYRDYKLGSCLAPCDVWGVLDQLESPRLQLQRYADATAEIRQIAGIGND